MHRCCASFPITHSVARGTHSNTVAVVLCVILQTVVVCHSDEILWTVIEKMFHEVKIFIKVVKMSSHLKKR